MTEIDQALTLLLNGSRSLFLDSLARLATRTIVWLPLAVVVFIGLIRRGHYKAILAILLCILIADQTASTLFKPMVARFRPTQDPHLYYLIDTVDGYRAGRYGFFSSHAANTAACTTFLSLLYRQRLLTWILASWVLLNCWTRVYLGVHYLGDITVGVSFGCLVGYSLHYLYTKKVHPVAISTSSAEIEAQTISLTLLLTYTLLIATALFA